jgi:hypothetical protein
MRVRDSVRRNAADEGHLMGTLRLQIAIEALSAAVLRAIAAGEDTDAVRVLASSAASLARKYITLVWGCN